MSISEKIFSLTADTKMNLRTIAGQAVYLLCILFCFILADSSRFSFE